MAKSNTSRIVIWTVVGILVVVAAVMFLKKPKDTTAGKPPVTQVQVTKLMGRLEKFEQKVVQKQGEFPGTPEKWQQVNDQVAKCRQILTDMQGLTEQKDLQAKLVEYQNGMIESRKLLKDITGQPEDAAGDTGE